MTSRDAILQAVRAARPSDAPLPDSRATTAAFDGARVDADALVVRFVESSRTAGADVVEATRDDLTGVIAELRPHARRIASAMPELSGTVPLGGDPHAHAETELFVCEAVLGVAENGAVWLPASRLGQRAALFLATDVVIALDRASIVATMHDAYARVDVAAESFGVFVAGPSKTADIEQSLVIGAHGPKALTIVLLT